MQQDLQSHYALHFFSCDNAPVRQYPDSLDSNLRQVIWYVNLRPTVLLVTIYYADGLTAHSLLGIQDMDRKYSNAIIGKSSVCVCVLRLWGCCMFATKIGCDNLLQDRGVWCSWHVSNIGWIETWQLLRETRWAPGAHSYCYTMCCFNIGTGISKRNGISLSSDAGITHSSRPW